MNHFLHFKHTLNTIFKFQYLYLRFFSFSNKFNFVFCLVSPNFDRKFLCSIFSARCEWNRNRNWFYFFLLHSLRLHTHWVADTRKKIDSCSVFRTLFALVHSQQTTSSHINWRLNKREKESRRNSNSSTNRQQYVRYRNTEYDARMREIWSERKRAKTTKNKPRRTIFIRNYNNNKMWNETASAAAAAPKKTFDIRYESRTRIPHSLSLVHV